MGVFTGLKTSFQAIALPTSILGTGAMIGHFGYGSIFAIPGVMMACDLAPYCQSTKQPRSGR
jgi:hypothetical protein